MKYYPPLSQLIAREALPSDIGLLGGVGETIEQVLNRLLDGIRFKDLVINQSAFGDIRFYSLTIVAKEMGFELPGTGLSFLLFPGADGLSEADIPITFEWRWGIKRYVHDFDAALFSGSPRGFFDLLLKVANITEAQFVDGIVRVLISDPDPYVTLVQDIKEFVSDYKNGLATLEDPFGEILANAAAILPGLDTLITELQDPTQMAAPFASEVDHIANSLENIATTLDFDWDVCLLAFDTVTRDVQNADEKLNRLLALFGAWFGGFDADDLQELLIPQMSVAIDPVPVGIEFPSKILREVDAEGKPLADPQNPLEDKPTRLAIPVASLKYSTATGFEFHLADSLNFDFPRSEILKSGLILELHEVKIDFSRTTNIPEAIADGRPADFVGVYVKDGSISFPAFWKQDAGSTGVVKARNLLIGTGGFSGTLSLEAKDGADPKPLIKCNFGDSFSVSLDAFSITLKQNMIKDSTIAGTLVIPGFNDANGDPAEIRIKVAIRQDGDFDITASEDDGFKTIKCGDVFDLTLKSVLFGKRDDDFYLGVSGTIEFKQSVLANLAPVEVEKLVIWSDGRFEIEGGTIPLPKNLRFPIGPAEISISAIHLGSHQRLNSNGSARNFRYFGFDGGVDVNPGGVAVRGRGIRFFYPEDLINVATDSYLEIKSIAIDLVIPGSASKDTATLLISGYLSIGGTPADPSYEGGVIFGLPKARIAGGASMQLRPKVPAFIVDAFVELSTPIPLGATSLGIYGFRGLFGQRYVATKAAAHLPDTSTWFDYYKVKDPNTDLEGISISKFEGPSQTKSYDGAFSIGAGVSLATAQDSGKTFSCKLFLLLSLPDLIYLEGKANILGERVGLTGEDPPFFAMLAISSQSVETGIGVNYQLPRDGAKKGLILDLNAEMRAAFFFQNSSAWYVNFGTIEHPNTARVLSLFNASSYVMLSAAGIAAGASVTFGFKKSYAGGMVRAAAEVYIKVGGFISFTRPQIGGFAMLGGHVDVSLMWFSFYLGIDTSLSVEAPKPFSIQGSVHLCVGVTIGFWKFKKHIEKCFDVEFKWEKDLSVDKTPVLPFADVTNPNVLSPIMGTNMLSGESFKVAFLGTSLPSAAAPEFDHAVLPLDTWVDLEFLKALVPGSNVDARIGRLSGQAPPNTIDYVPPAQVPHKVAHQYSIKAVEIKAWSGNAWVDYRPYEAMSPPDALAALGANPSAYKDGFWQNTGSGFNKIRLLAETSFSYMQQGQPDWYVPEQFGITSATLFCRTKLRDKHCLRWTEVPSGTVYPADAWRQVDAVLYRVSGGAGAAIDWPSPAGIPRSLLFTNEATAQVVFNKPCAEVDLKLTTFSTGAVIRFYQRETAGVGFVYMLVETRSLTQLQLLAPVRYTNPDAPIAKVEIDPITADAAVIAALRVKLDELYRELYESNLDADARKELEKKIRQVEEQLIAGAGKGCTSGIDKQTLLTQLQIIEAQLDECVTQLAALQDAQQQACKRSADISALFARCFPQAPSLLSYEIVERINASGRTEFQFKIYDDLRDTILFNGTQAFADRPGAEQAVFASLELAYWPNDYALMAPRNEKQFFQLIDRSSRFTAVNPAFFTRWDQLLISWEQTVATCRAARIAGTFSLGRRVGGKLICEENLAHLECWNQLSTFGGIAPRNCETIVAGIVAARAAYCGEYNKLYRALYDCNKQLLDEAIRDCENLTHTVEVQHQQCQALAEQLAAIRQLISFIDQHGPLLPPPDYPCSTLVHEVCCLSLEDYQFNLSIPSQAAIDQDFANALQASEKWLTPVWRPTTKYCVHLQVTDTVNGSATPDNDFYFGFRTAGPLGHFHHDLFADYVDTTNDKQPDQYMLTGLKGYVDYRRSYPNADGELVGAKPLFYEDARILLFFTKRYAYHFFSDWPSYNGLPALSGNKMQIVIKDPAENTSIPNPPPPDVITTEIPQAVLSWPSDDDPRIPEDLRTLLNLHNPELLNPDFVGGDCWVSGGQMIKPASVYTKITPRYLKPLKLYTAVVNNAYQGKIEEVLQYPFQTSSYPNFEAQIKSYHLDDGKGSQRDAVFQIALPLSVTDINLMYDVVTGNMSAANAALAGAWADPFDRLVEAVLKLTPLDAAIGTEFNIVRNSITNAVVAVWICNPEPLNDPKLPDDVLKGSLRVMAGLSPDLNYSVLFSKDRAQAFVMHPAKVIPLTQMKFRFAYMEWDGSAYVEHAVVISDFVSTLP
ncbi:MAG TPA: hypothetical protein VN643_15375 [Pyrinomonadaceae bacterium]|nr:hypothetical protein [Pyrinomonadaceae bacterium]